MIVSWLLPAYRRPHWRLRRLHLDQQLLYTSLPRAIAASWAKCRGVSEFGSSSAPRIGSRRDCALADAVVVLLDRCSTRGFN